MAKNDLTDIHSTHVIRLAGNVEEEALDTINVNSFVPSRFNKIVRSEINATTEDYVYSFSGSAVAVVRVIYTDATKEAITSVERTS